MELAAIPRNPKSLLIVVPTPPDGSIRVGLHDWLTLLETQATSRRLLNRLKEEMADFGDRVRLGEAANHAGTDFAKNLAHFRWWDTRVVEEFETMIPPDWDVVTQINGGRPIASNRNDIVRRFLATLNHETGQFEQTLFGALLMVDSDVIPPPDAILRICYALERPEVEVVSGIYCRDTPEAGVCPHIYKILDDRRCRYAGETVMGVEDLVEVPDGGVPGGFLAIKAHVLIGMIDADMVPFKDRFSDGSLEPWELTSLREKNPGDAAFGRAVSKRLQERMADDWGQWELWGGWKTGEDIWFCRNLQRLGFRLWIDRKIHCHHWKDLDLKSVFLDREKAANKLFHKGFEAGQKGSNASVYEAMMAENAEALAHATDKFARAAKA